MSCEEMNKLSNTPVCGINKSGATKHHIQHLESRPKVDSERKKINAERHIANYKVQ